MPVRVAINGFGRIGRNILRAAKRDGSDIDFVAINDLADAETLAHLLCYDSVHGRYAGDVRAADGALLIDNDAIRVLSERDPGQLPWGELGIDVVIECTGLFRSRDKASRHLSAGARKVVISAPGDDPDVTVCLGVNHEEYEPEQHHIISNASCTTNCLAPVAMVLHAGLTIEKGWMTTIHAYTSDQRLLDAPHKDRRRGRSAALSMIPTTTGAARAVGLVLPALRGKLDGCSIRVPTPDVSIIDLVAKVGRKTTPEEVNDIMRAAAGGTLDGILAVSDEPLVSADYVGSCMSATVDAEFTRVVGDDMVQVIAWYDNEMGYSTRVKELVEYIGARL